ncbi:Hsp70 family protein [Granulicoccus sp. GXG6511]|uniref:Hsp70 family protein n=1 Tax=Granulicoccus sp. GXG6511 TaxID=3381351 RepID=UPI003D7E7A5E
MAQGYDLAIDFGTSNTSASIRRSGTKPVTLRLSADGNLLPSAVLLRGDGYLVGDEAIRTARLAPEAFERTPKRRLGEPAVLLAGRTVPPEHLVATVLHRVYQQAVHESHGETPQHIVLTHPHAWGAHRQSQLLRAAKEAGMDPDRVYLVSEPIAAAWHNSAQVRAQPGQLIAVVDFGGGTFDVALLRIGTDGRTVEVLAADGIDPLGGDDFDQRIERWVGEQLQVDHPQVLARLRSPGAIGDRLTMREEVRQAKHQLSRNSTAEIVVPGEPGLVLTLTVGEFENMIRPAVERAAEVTQRLLGGQSAQVFLTGGSSGIPLVQRTFVNLAQGRVGTLGDPKEVTALGALTPPESAPEPEPQPDPALVKAPRRWLVPALAAVVVLAVLIGALVWPRAGTAETSGGTAVTASPSPGTSPGTPPTGATSPGTGTTPERSARPTVAPPCGALDTDHCALLREVIPTEAMAGSCQPVTLENGWLSINCVASPRGVPFDGGSISLFATRVPEDQLDLSFHNVYVTNKVDPSPGNIDLAKPPARYTWLSDTDGSGEVGSLWDPESSVHRLFWSNREHSAIMVAVSADVPVATMAQWFWR